MGAVKKVHGIAWGCGVIANVTWGGVRLCDVLHRAGIQMNGSAHVLFASYVTLCQDDCYYGASIPLAKAQNRNEDVLLAFEVYRVAHCFRNNIDLFFISEPDE
jgi:sulfite oxidase